MKNVGKYIKFSKILTFFFQKGGRPKIYDFFLEPPLFSGTTDSEKNFLALFLYNIKI